MADTFTFSRETEPMREGEKERGEGGREGEEEEDEEEEEGEGEGRRRFDMSVVLTCKCSAVNSLIPENKNSNYGTCTWCQEPCSASHEIGIITIFQTWKQMLRKQRHLPRVTQVASTEPKFKPYSSPTSSHYITPTACNKRALSNDLN